MFANPIWSVVLLVAPLLLYFLVIRPKAPVLEVAKHADFWSRTKARLKAFQTFWIATLGAVLIALPDILVQIAPLDFSGLLPQPWAAYVSPACLTLNVVLKAFQTTPVYQPPPQG